MAAQAQITKVQVQIFGENPVTLYNGESFYVSDPSKTFYTFVTIKNTGDSSGDFYLQFLDTDTGTVYLQPAIGHLSPGQETTYSYTGFFANKDPLNITVKAGYWDGTLGKVVWDDIFKYTLTGITGSVVIKICRYGINIPKMFNPSSTTTITLSIINTGNLSGNGFCHIKNTDTNQILGTQTFYQYTGSQRLLAYNIIINQDTTFNGKIEAGHNTTIDDTYSFTIKPSTIITPTNSNYIPDNDEGYHEETKTYQIGDDPTIKEIKMINKGVVTLITPDKTDDTVIKTSINGNEIVKDINSQYTIITDKNDTVKFEIDNLGDVAPITISYQITTLKTIE